MQSRMVQLLETVQNNTNLQVCFTVNDATTLRMVKDFIPTVLEYYEGPARYDAKGNRLPNEQVYQAPRFSNNDLLELTNAPGMALCRVKQGFGYTDTAGTWIPLHLPFAITAEQHAEYSAKPWPAKQPGMLVIPRRPEAPPAPPTYPERLLAARLIAPDDLASRLLAPPVSNDWTNRFAELEKLLADRTPTEAPPNA